MLEFHWGKTVFLYVLNVNNYCRMGVGGFITTNTAVGSIGYVAFFLRPNSLFLILK